jgi:hypothetical protein
LEFGFVWILHGYRFQDWDLYLVDPWIKALDSLTSYLYFFSELILDCA